MNMLNMINIESWISEQGKETKQYNEYFNV